jgi:hypothetical protein
MNCFTRRFYFGLATVLQALQEDYSIYKGLKFVNYFALYLYFQLFFHVKSFIITDRITKRFSICSNLLDRTLYRLITPQ